MKKSLVASAAAGFIVAGLSMQASAQTPQGCAKEVFNKYCLGGSADPLLSRNSPHRTSEKDGVTLYVFQDGPDQTNVAVFAGSIGSVSRRYAGSTQTFDQMSKELRGFYGEPRRTTAPGGRITELWDRGDWRINLSWDGTRDVVLTYNHEGLQAARRAAKGKGGYPGSTPSPGGSYNANPKGY
jgi:hypothetical protein